MAFVAKMRNRIIGLLIIVTLIIIILPALMSSQGRGARKNNELIAITREGAVTDEDGQLMPAQEPDYATLLDPVDDLGPAASSGTGTVNEQPSAAQREGAETLNAGPAARPRPAETLTAPAYGPAQSPVPATTSASGSGTAPAQRPLQQGKYTVQVGVFSAADRADKLVGQLRARGITASVQRDRRDHKEVFRVCAGNARSRKDLEGLLRRIELAVNIQGIIVER